MSDVAQAYDILDQLWPAEETPRQLVIKNAYDAIKRVERSLPKEVLKARKREWTPRRIQSIVDLEARRIDAYELRDLEQMAIQEARNALRKSKERSARLAALIARAAAHTDREVADRQGQ